MKLHHFGILFTVLAVALFLTMDIKTNNLKHIQNESVTMNRCLERAIDDGTDALAISYDVREMQSSKEDCVSSFFRSFYASLGISADSLAQENLRRYIPVIAVTADDGMYLFYHDEYKTHDVTTYAMRWSERYPYAYEDESFIYSFTMSDIVKIYDKKHLLTSSNEKPFLEIDFHDIAKQPEYRSFRTANPNHFLLDENKFYLRRKEVMIQTINEKLAFYINQHNMVASQYGITYDFSLPAIDESELMRSVEHPGMIVLLQGYPLRAQGELYNRVEIAGAQIYKKGNYFLESVGWYKLYHKETCEKCMNNANIDFSHLYHSIEECVSAGAYACEKCCEGGVHVPNYHNN